MSTTNNRNDADVPHASSAIVTHAGGRFSAQKTKAWTPLRTFSAVQTTSPTQKGYVTPAHTAAEDSVANTDTTTELSAGTSSNARPEERTVSVSPAPISQPAASPPDVPSQELELGQGSSSRDVSSAPDVQPELPDVIITTDIPSITVPTGPASRTRSSTDRVTSAERTQRRRQLDRAAQRCLEESRRFRPDGERIPDGHISLTIRDIHDNTVDFNLRPLTPLGDIFEMFLCHIQKSRRDVRFMFDHIRLTDIHTPAELGMRSGDSIDCFWAVLGGDVRRLLFTSHFKYY